MFYVTCRKEPDFGLKSKFMVSRCGCSQVRGIWTKKTRYLLCTYNIQWCNREQKIRTDSKMRKIGSVQQSVVYTSSESQPVSPVSGEGKFLDISQVLFLESGSLVYFTPSLFVLPFWAFGFSIICLTFSVRNAHL